MKNELSILTNSTFKTHADYIKELAAGSTNIYIATAFLKSSGLNPILKTLKKFIRDGGRIQIIAGQDFGLTEPSALWDLFHLFENSSSELRLANFSKTSTFHPKIYLFERPASASVLIGSSNMTSGGFFKNEECSMAYTGSLNGQAWTDSKVYFDNLFNDLSMPATRLSIANYEHFYNRQKPKHEELKRKPTDIARQDVNIYVRFKDFLEKNKTIDWASLHSKRSKNYNQAKKILDGLAVAKGLTKSEFDKKFRNLIQGQAGLERLWHSNGLWRGYTGKNGQPGVLDNWTSVVELIIFIKKHHHEDVSKVFEQGKKLVDGIPGIGVNILTEMLLTYDPARYANLNNNPLGVFKEYHIQIVKTPGIYTGETYLNFCLLIKEIGSQLGFKDMMETDTFFNEIYQHLKRTGKIRK